MKKKCGLCKSEKERTEFGIHRGNRDMLNDNCKECERQRQVEYRAKKKKELFSEYKYAIGFF